MVSVPGTGGITSARPLEHNGQLVRGQGYVSDDFTTRAISFIEAHHEQPVLRLLAFYTPHSPMQVPDRYFNRFREQPLLQRHRDPDREDVAHTRAALAMCENIDHNVGRLLDRLDDLQLADNTIVVYFSDNGPNGYRYNGDMRGRKGSTDEGGVRSPLLVRWPPAIKAGRRVEPIAAAIDLLPTLADAAQVTIPNRQALDGVSLMPLLTEAEPEWPERMIFAHWQNRVSVRTQQYRLDFQGRLYDLDADPGQRQDIAADHPRVAARLRAAVEDWKAVVLKGYDRRDRPFPVGHANFPATQLPARDATLQGRITRSNRFPNCSYLTDWTSTSDRITWDIEVLEPGSYAIDVYYTCPAADIGATVELSFRDRQVRARVMPAHDPPLVGGEHDRVPRQESYVKDFHPLRIGTLELPAGRGELTLRAVEIPGRQVMDFRLLMLSR